MYVSDRSIGNLFRFRRYFFYLVRSTSFWCQSIAAPNYNVSSSSPCLWSARSWSEPSVADRKGPTPVVRPGVGSGGGVPCRSGGS